MQIYEDLEQVHFDGPTVLTIGNFDGVHLGHQALLETVIDLAGSWPGMAASSVIVTFEPHPLKVLRPELSLDLLTTPLERLQICAGMGIDIGIVQPFTRELATFTASEFIALLHEHLGMAALVVGPDFALGKDRSGTLDVLAALGEEFDYRLIVQDLVDNGQHSIRSKTIRQLLYEGDVSAAAKLLGRYYHMVGEVEFGEQRGREFGIPTANLLIPEDKLWPANGVYVTRTWIVEKRRSFSSVTNVGYRPTVNGHSRRIESHLLDFPPRGESGNLYGKQLVVEFLGRLRGEQKFDGPDQLIAQIHADITHARQFLDDAPPASPPFFLTPLSET
ncbi:MAG: bifunctional riboflavin kinase/FAD synthetase [Caldilineaceae bacterium]